MGLVQETSEVEYKSGRAKRDAFFVFSRGANFLAQFTLRPGASDLTGSFRLAPPIFLWAWFEGRGLLGCIARRSCSTLWRCAYLKGMCSRWR